LLDLSRRHLEPHRFRVECGASAALLGNVLVDRGRDQVLESSVLPYINLV